MAEKSLNRISNLPDSLIHHILCFLDMREVVQTSILSTKWRYLWTSTPHLNFNFPELDPYNRDPFTRLLRHRKYTNILNQALLLHDTSSILKFNLCSEVDIGLDTLNACLDQLSRQHVQEITIHSSFSDPGELTGTIFSSELKKMKIASYSGDNIETRLPTTMCSAVNIKCIYLSGIKFPAGDSEGKFVLSLSHLESLKLSFCTLSHLRVLTISAPLLESFTFRERICGGEGGKCDVNLLSPNLTSLNYDGMFFGNHSFGNLSVLDKADIFMPCGGNDKFCVQHPVRVLFAIHDVKALKISNWLVKTIAGSPEMLKMLPSSFPNLRYMKLTEFSTDGTSICAISSLLLRLPHIETLVWQRKTRTWPLEERGIWPHEDEGDEDLKELSSIQCNFHCLKTVEIQNSVGFKNELMLIEFLHERAPNMKEINIITGPMGKRLREFRKKLLSLRCASSDLHISFQCKVDFHEAYLEAWLAKIA